MTVTSIKVRLPTKFPSSVSANSPITLSSVSGSYSFSLDISALRTSLDPYYAVGTINSIILNGATSGTTTLQATSIASGTMTLPAATDTVVGKATTDVLTNKTFDTAGTGNVFKVNGTQITAKTGTGSVVLATSPALTTPSLDVATCTSLSGTAFVGSSGTGGVGYTTGAGGAVTQLTSRTTGVTLNKTTGAITLFTAAGSSTPASFTVTNSTVAANDLIIVNVKSGASNTYITYVTAVAGGSFQITFSATVGTASDTPIFSFAVIKGQIT